MGFLAGIVLENPPEGPWAGLRERFIKALGQMEGLLPWKPHLIELEKALLARAGFSTMWQGQKEIQSNGRVTVATGLQAKPLPATQNATEYILNAAAGKASLSPKSACSYFDYFSLASLGGQSEEVLLLTDPLGLSPIYWVRKGGFLLFSSRQTFLRLFLGESCEPDLLAAMEYLVIGHPLGSKSLIRGVELLDPGSMLRYGKGRLSVESYTSTALRPTQSISLLRAADMVAEFLRAKVDSYFQLHEGTVASFLSGGWDSRLLAALFKEAGKLKITFTTQQQVRFQGQLISEKAIAEEVAQLLGVENRFVSPEYRSPRSRARRAALLDYTTWFHDWAFSVTRELPMGRHLLADGLLGDILLRGLYVSEDLEKSKEMGIDRTAELLSKLYLRGFNPYTRGLERWKEVLGPELTSGFASALRREIRGELEKAPAFDPITMFLVRNRSRRGISPLPMLIFGSKGEVLLPFCDPQFIALALSIPTGVRKDPGFYEALLERVAPGLGKIVSTNTQEPSRLKPYLVNSVQDLAPTGKSGHNYEDLTRRAKEWVNDLVERPPEVLIAFLQPEIQKAILDKDMEALLKKRFFLDRIMILESFFRGEVG